MPPFELASKARRVAAAFIRRAFRISSRILRILIIVLSAASPGMPPPPPPPPQATEQRESDGQSLEKE